MRKSTLTKMMAVATAIALTTAACSDDDDSTSTGPVPGNANVRVIHASYDAPPVDIIIDGAVSGITNLDYYTSSGYAQVPAGTRNVQVTATGTTSPAVINADLTLTEGTDYTVFAVNNLSNIEPIVAIDDRTVNPNKARIRFIHGSPDAPPVDIKINTGAGPAAFTNASYPSAKDYIEVDAGSYSFVVTAAGSTDEVLVFDPVTVENGGVYSVVAHGTLDGADAYDFTATVFVDVAAGNLSLDLAPSGTAEVMVVHASPDAPGVDLLIDNFIVNSAALGFPNNTGYLTYADGMRNVKVNASGTTTTVINADVTLAPGGTFSVFAIDSLTSIEPLVVADDLTAPAAGKAHVRFIHLSPDAPNVDVALQGGAVLFGDRAFKQQPGAFTPLDAGTYDLEVRLAGTGTVVLPLPGITLEDGKIYTVFAKGFAFAPGSTTAPLGAQIIVNN